MISAILTTMEDERERSKLEFLYEEYGKRMYHAAFSILKNKEDAEDATHDTFLKISKVISTVDISESRRTLAYLLTAVRNTSYTILSAKAPSLYETEDTDIAAMSGALSDPKEIYIDNEVFDTVTETIKSLDRKYRDVLYYRIVEEMRDKEIASLLGINYSTVRIRIKRGRSVLIRMLNERGIYGND